MTPPRGPHPAAALSEALRVDYLSAIASLVRADGRTAASELARVRRLTRALELGEAATEEVERAVVSPNFARIEETLRRFCLDDTLRFSLMTDALVVAFADGRIASAESSEIGAFASVLGFTVDQVLTLGRHIEGTLLHRKKGEPQLADALLQGLQGLPADPASAKVALDWLSEHLDH